MDTLESLRAECDTLLAMQAGTTAVLFSLIATHPDHDQFQLHLTSCLELALNGSLARSLSPKQQAQAREFVEQLQRTKKVTSRIAPLG